MKKKTCLVVLISILLVQFRAFAEEGTLDKDVVGGSTKMDSALDLIRSAVNQAEQDGGLEGTQEVREQDGIKLQSSDNSMTSSQEGSNSDSGIVRRIGDIIDEVTGVNKDGQKLAELTECFEKLLEKRKEEKERALKELDVVLNVLIGIQSNFKNSIENLKSKNEATIYVRQQYIGKILKAFNIIRIAIEKDSSSKLEIKEDNV